MKIIILIKNIKSNNNVYVLIVYSRFGNVVSNILPHLGKLKY